MSVSHSISQSVTVIRTGAPDHVSVNGLLTAARGSVPVSVCEMDAGERKVARFIDTRPRLTPTGLILALALAALPGLKSKTA